jgi:hypothetical protein
MDVVFLAPAQAELAEAVVYDNAQREGLVEEFTEEVRRTLARIIEYPEAWSLLSRRTRRCPTKRFPYGVIYQVLDDTLLIIAVMHLHRAPHAWRSRLPRREQ